MPIIEAAQEVCSFGGIDFAREVTPGGFPLRPRRVTVVSIDHVLDTDEAYRDYGGSTYGPISIRAIFNTRAEAEAFADLDGTTDTLELPGWSGVRIMTNPDLTYVTGQWFAVDCSFD